MTLLLRKNAAHLTDEEWTAFCNALQAMKDIGAYDYFVGAHGRAVLDYGTITAPKKSDFKPEGINNNGAHRGPAFLPWHRALLMDFENELQKYIDPKYQGMGIPYWDWTQDPDGKSIFKPQYLGTQGTPLTDGMFSKWECVELNEDWWGALKNIGPLNRAFNVFDSMPDMSKTVPGVMCCGLYDSFSTATYDDSFRRQLERQLHNPIHMWIGGLMASVPISPNDPAFYLHHCNVDRLWTRWQEMHPSAAYFQDPNVILPYGQNYTDILSALSWTPQQVWDYTKLGYTYERDSNVRRVAAVSYSSTYQTRYSSSPATEILSTGDAAPSALAMQVGYTGWQVRYEDGDNQFRQLQVDLAEPSYQGPVPGSFKATASFHDKSTNRYFFLQVQAAKLFLTGPATYGALLVGWERVTLTVNGSGTSVPWSYNNLAVPSNTEYAMALLSNVQLAYGDSTDHWISGERVWIDQLPVDKVPTQISGSVGLWDDSGHQKVSAILTLEIMYFGKKPSASSQYNCVLSNVVDQRITFDKTVGTARKSVALSVPPGTQLTVPILAGANWSYTSDHNLAGHLAGASSDLKQLTCGAYLWDKNNDDEWEGDVHVLVLCFSPYWV